MSSIPASVSEIFEPLRNELWWLHAHWQTFDQLFGSSRERIKLMNEIAPGAFRCIQDAMLDGIQIGICRLMDRPKSMGRDNLTVPQLRERLKAINDPTYFPRSEQVFAELERRCQHLREHRNKRLAHLDLEVALALGAGAAPLPPITSQTIREALSSLCDYLNTVEEQFDGSTSGYARIITKGDGDALIYRLVAGMRYEDHVQENRIADWDDLPKGKWSDAL